MAKKPSTSFSQMMWCEDRGASLTPHKRLEHGRVAVEVYSRIWQTAKCRFGGAR